MKPHYFDQEQADVDDMMLGMAKIQGYVPDKCLLGGMVVMADSTACQPPHLQYWLSSGSATGRL